MLLNLYFHYSEWKDHSNGLIPATMVTIVWFKQKIWRAVCWYPYFPPWPPLSPGIKYITIESESEVGGNRESESQKLETANEEWNLGSCSSKGVELECVWCGTWSLIHLTSVGAQSWGVAIFWMLNIQWFYSDIAYCYYYLRLSTGTLFHFSVLF